MPNEWPGLIERPIIWIGQMVELVDGCDGYAHQPPHRDGGRHSACVTARYKVRIVEVDSDGVYFWARPAG